MIAFPSRENEIPATVRFLDGPFRGVLTTIYITPEDHERKWCMYVYRGEIHRIYMLLTGIWQAFHFVPDCQASHEA